MNTYLGGWQKQILPGHVFLECNLEASLTFYNSKTNSTAKIQGDESPGIENSLEQGTPGSGQVSIQKNKVAIKQEIIMFLITIQRDKKGSEGLFCIMQNLKYHQSHSHKQRMMSSLH